MKSSFRFILVVMVLATIFSLSAVSASITECSGGMCAVTESVASSPIMPTLTQSETFNLPGGVVAAGVGMRNRGYGNITIAGIPGGSTIEKAYLYWDILANTEGATFNTGNFSDVVTTGSKIAEGGDVCWGTSANFAYRADVTGLVSGNGEYPLTNFTSARTDGADGFSYSDSPLIDGASLVVVYRNSASLQQTIVIYDGDETLAGTSFKQDIAGFTVPASFTRASITFIGADGQTNGNDDTYFNDILIGPNTWDGSDHVEGPDFGMGNLWDTDTFEVTSYVQPGDTSANATVDGYNDCLVWTTTVFAIESPSEEMPITIDIKPKSCPNAFNRKDTGTLPVAIVGNSGFDVTTINTTAPITLNGVSATRWALNDTATPYTGTAPCGCNNLAGDGYMDLVVHFPVKNIRASLPTAQINDFLPLTLQATLKSGETIEASDCIKIVK